jgi:DNA helicase IV
LSVLLSESQSSNQQHLIQMNKDLSLKIQKYAMELQMLTNASQLTTKLNNFNTDSVSSINNNNNNNNNNNKKVYKNDDVLSTINNKTAIPLPMSSTITDIIPQVVTEDVSKELNVLAEWHKQQHDSSN